MTTSPVSASRKLFVAALLLAGGYGVALLFGKGVPTDLLPGTSDASASAPSGWLSAIDNRADRPEAVAPSGALVPEMPLTGNLKPANQPTWLAATPDLGSPRMVASHSANAPPPLVPPVPLPIAPPVARTSEPQPVSPTGQPFAPKARITNVVASSTPAATAAASPWDRWPRWDANNSTAERGPVAATFQEVAPTASHPQQAAFNHSEIVRKNSPPRDRGAAIDTPSGRTHIVVDGDSLTRLAERYLDDAALAEEIYRLNSDVLTSPELLPIGVELKIPDMRMADTAALPFTSSYAASSRAANSAMVPVDWVPRNFDGPPRAELMPPIAAHSD